MPHDKNGSLLKAGDTVTLKGKVRDVQTGETACNCTVDIEGPEASCVTLNSKSVEKVGASDTQEAANKGFETSKTDAERYPKAK